MQRGITVCADWVDSFQTFLADVGPRPSSKHSLERVNNDLGYIKGNVTWATADVQSNNRRTNVFIEFNGERLTQSQWAAKLGVSRELIHTRLKAGWTVARTLTEPPNY